MSILLNPILIYSKRQEIMLPYVWTITIANWVIAEAKLIWIIYPKIPQLALNSWTVVPVPIIAVF